MPIKMEISGGTIAEFYGEAMNVFLVLSKAGSMFTPNPAAATGGAVATQPPAEDGVQVAEPVGDVTKIDPPITALKPRRNAKKTETNELTPAVPAATKSEPLVLEDIPAELVRKEPAKVDEDPLGLSDGGKPEDKGNPLTLDDMRDRVKAIVAAHTGRGNKMPDCIAYVRKLFEPFGIKLAAELKPEKFDEFWLASAKFLDGTAK